MDIKNDRDKVTRTLERMDEQNEQNKNAFRNRMGKSFRSGIIDSPPQAVSGRQRSRSDIQRWQCCSGKERDSSEKGTTIDIQSYFRKHALTFLAWISMTLAIISGATIGPFFKYMEISGISPCMAASWRSQTMLIFLVPLAIVEIIFHRPVIDIDDIRDTKSDSDADDFVPHIDSNSEFCSTTESCTKAIVKGAEVLSAVVPANKEYDTWTVDEWDEDEHYSAAYTNDRPKHYSRLVKNDSNRTFCDKLVSSANNKFGSCSWIFAPRQGDLYYSVRTHVIISGVAWSLNLIFWIISLEFISTFKACLICNTHPIILVTCLYYMGVKVTWIEWLGVFIAFSGLVLDGFKEYFSNDIPIVSAPVVSMATVAVASTSLSAITAKVKSGAALTTAGLIAAKNIMNESETITPDIVSVSPQPRQNFLRAVPKEYLNSNKRTVKKVETVVNARVTTGQRLLTEITQWFTGDKSYIETLANAVFGSDDTSNVFGESRDILFLLKDLNSSSESATQSKWRRSLENKDNAGYSTTTGSYTLTERKSELLKELHEVTAEHSSNQPRLSNMALPPKSTLSASEREALLERLEEARIKREKSFRRPKKADRDHKRVHVERLDNIHTFESHIKSDVHKKHNNHTLDDMSMKSSNSTVVTSSSYSIRSSGKTASAATPTSSNTTTSLVSGSTNGKTSTFHGSNRSGIDSSVVKVNSSKLPQTNVIPEETQVLTKTETKTDTNLFMNDLIGSVLCVLSSICEVILLFNRLKTKKFVPLMQYTTATTIVLAIISTLSALILDNRKYIWRIFSELLTNKFDSVTSWAVQADELPGASVFCFNEHCIIGWLVDKWFSYTLIFGLIVGVICISGFNYAMQYIPPILFSSLSLMTPALTALVSYFVGIESWPTVSTWIGGAIVLVGVATVSIGEHLRKEQKHQRKKMPGGSPVSSPSRC